MFATRFIRAHAGVLSIGALVFLFLGFVDTIPDEPGVLKQRGVHSAPGVHAHVLPAQPIVVATAVSVSLYADFSLNHGVPPEVTFAFSNSDQLSSAGDTSPPQA